MEYGNAAGISYLGPRDTPTAPARESVNSALERCGRLLNELAIQEQRLDAIAQRVDGPRVENSKDPGNPPPPPHLVGSAAYIAANLERMIGRIGSYINNIESALG